MTERNYAASGYNTTSTGSSGVIVVNGAQTAAFTNTFDDIDWPETPGTKTNIPTYIPKTGGPLSGGIGFSLLLASAILGLSVCANPTLRKKRPGK